MNWSLNIVERIVRRTLGIGVGVLVASLFVGCSTTHQVKQSPKDFSGFLGDYSELKPGTGDQVNYLYIDQNANWKKFTKAYIEPIELWVGEDSKSSLGKMSPEDQQMLVNYLHTSLADALGKDLTIVGEPGSDVLVVHCAITQGQKSKPVMNLVSTVVPIGMAVSAGKQIITGTGTGVGVVSIEAELLDGQTNQRIAAAVDERAGTKALRSKFSGSWGDLKAAFDWWANRLEKRVSELKASSDVGGQL